MPKLRIPVSGCTPIWPPLEAPEPSALHPPLEGCDPVPISDHAYAKLTRQSSLVAEPATGWMFATEPESEPWWEIDLGEFMLVERVVLWIAPPRRPAFADTEVCIEAHAIHTPEGKPAPHAYRWRARLDELPAADEGSVVVWTEPDTVARHVRVTLRREGGAPVALLVRGAKILGAPLFGDTLLASYARAFTLFADRPLFSARREPGAGRFEITHRYRDVWTQARAQAAALASILESNPVGDRIFLGLCTRNRPEWVIGDLAAVMRGYVVVPLSPDDSDDRLAAVLARCPLHAALVDGQGAARFSSLSPHRPSPPLLIICDPSPSPIPQLPFADLIARGAALTPPPPTPRDPRDLYSLLFTSGSSGVPKGAMRSYATFHAMLRTYGVAQPAVHLSFQPLSHLSERMYLPSVILHGGRIGFSGGGAHLLSDLRAIEPSLLGSVPRLFEIVMAAYERRLAAALAAAPDEPREDVEARVLAETRTVFGARLQGIGIGSAPVSPAVLAFLRRCFSDIWVSDGYGSTECGTITNDGHIRPEVEVKLVPVDGMAENTDRGEIWVRTPHIIDGYYGDPESTAQSLDAEGYFRTGDLGERDPDGSVRVVGRIKNVIKLGQGEFVAVDRIEAELASCPLVDQIFVHPDASSSALLAVVVPRFATLGLALGIPELSPSEIANHPDAAAVITRALAEHGRRAGLAGFELPRAVLVEPEPMTVASGLLTASGKLARPAAIARYAPRLAGLEREGPVIAAGDSLPGRLAALVSGIIGRRVHAEEPLHQALGADSLAIAEILGAASSMLGRDVPLSSWFEARTLADLARRLDAGILGARPALDEQPRGDLDLPLPSREDGPAARVPFQRVLLTGATGLLGAHLLEALLARSTAHVVCLVRAPSDEAAATRVREAVARHAIVDLDPTRWTALAADLAAPDLGLPPERRRDLAIDVDAVVHAAAAVNWLQPYEALRAPNVLGTLEMLALAASGRRKPFHFVSTISTARPDGDESSQLPFEQARSAGGYGLSKWVAEELVRRAGERGQPIAVYRPAMITGHSRRGIGNPDDYVHRYLRAMLTTGRYLDAPGERIDMTPVDFVAQAIVALMLAHPEGGVTHHLSNIDQSMTYADLGRAAASAGYPCSPAAYAEFRALAIAPGAPLRALAAYFSEAGFTLHMGPWPSARTRAALAALGVVCPPVDERLVATYLKSLVERGYSQIRGPSGSV